MQSDEDVDQIGTDVVDAVPELGRLAGHTSSLQLASIYLQGPLYNFWTSCPSSGASMNRPSSGSRGAAPGLHPNFTASATDREFAAMRRGSKRSVTLTSYSCVSSLAMPSSQTGAQLVTFGYELRTESTGLLSA
jgi:hypothetical protein